MVRKTFIVLVLATSSHAALAQQGQSIGGQLQQIPPPPIATKTEPELKVDTPSIIPDADVAGPRIRVDALRLTGQTLFDDAVLTEASGFVAGSQLNLSDLRAIAARIAMFYRARGYFVAQAYLPAQNVQLGSVTIAIVEGRYGTIGLSNHSNLSDDVVRRSLRGLDTGDVITNAPLERRLLLLSDIPGVTVRSTLLPGTVAGTSNLNVDVAQGRRISGSIEADNAGNRYTGAYRLGGGVNLNNATGLGDMISLRVLASTDGLAYGRASWQVAVDALTIGVAYAHFRYDLGKEFESLGAHGTADVASVYASYPLVRSRTSNVYATADFSQKWYDDRTDFVGSQSLRSSRAVTLGLNGNARDGFAGGGWTDASIGWTLGDLTLRSPFDRAADDATAHSAGSFGKIQFSASRLQTIGGPFTLYGAVRGQIAFNNLDISEKMELGGAYGVRAYPEGESYGDQGYIATIEGRVMLTDGMPKFPGRLQLIGFVDSGSVRYAKNPWFTGSNNATRSGYGAGLLWLAPENFIVRVSYARRIGDTPSTSAPDQSGRFWFQLTKLF